MELNEKSKQDICFTSILKFPNSRLIDALEESENIISGKIKAKRYKNFDELIENID